MNPKSLENLKNNPNLRKYGTLNEGQISHTVRVRINESTRAKLKEMSPQELGLIIETVIKLKEARDG